MGELIKDIATASYQFITHRLLWLFVVTAFLFYVMLAQLFQLQIVQHDMFATVPPITRQIEQPIPAIRGNIYDRFGVPLAVNKLVFVVTIDPTQTISNEALFALAQLFELNDEKYVNSFPMTTVWPYEFMLGGSTPEIQQRREYRWKHDMAIPNHETATAAESFLHLREWFRLDPELSNADARRILNLRTKIFERRFRPQVFVVATNVSPYTIAAIEEQRDLFNGIGITTDSLRVYPQGVYFSHLLGFVGPINAEELAANPDYNHDDIIGKAGLEQSMEPHLRGHPGVQIVEVNPSTGRRIGSTPKVTHPTPGSSIFLTIDAGLQRQTYHILKEYLTEIAIRRLDSGGAAREPRITYQQVFINLIQAGWIPLTDIFNADTGSAAYVLRRYILDSFPTATALSRDREEVADILTDGIQAGHLTPAMLFETMVELEILSDHDGFLERIHHQTAVSLIIEKLRMGELTPQMVNVDPSTGSVMVVCVPTGAVLAAVSYPSYDNNRLTNRIDAEYFARLNLDPTHPMMNRPFREARAPGSTFKMITAVAGLETGVIGPATTIHDGIVFTRAGSPTARCMSSAGHGRINVVQAISTSCNYFFFETAFRLGHTQHDRIEVLNRYMELFGLNERSGVEIGEFADSFNRENVANIMASPELKRFLWLGRNPFATTAQLSWFDGDTIRTAIGQSYNNYTSAMMARYIAQIANNGLRLPLHLVGSIECNLGTVKYQAVPIPDNTNIEVSSSTWEVVQNGMLQATEGWGTATSHFRGFPVQVAGKTGTAEQINTRLSHTSFGGYAPFDNPQIAIYVMIPFGSTNVMPAASTQIARDVFHAALRLDAVAEHSVPLNTLTR